LLAGPDVDAEPLAVDPPPGPLAVRGRGWHWRRGDELQGGPRRAGVGGRAWHGTRTSGHRRFAPIRGPPAADRGRATQATRTSKSTEQQPPGGVARQPDGRPPDPARPVGPAADAGRPARRRVWRRCGETPDPVGRDRPRTLLFLIKQTGGRRSSGNSGHRDCLQVLMGTCRRGCLEG
jgi:hypothetical protein